MPRVSELIEHAARRAKRKARDSRTIWMLLGVIALLALVGGLYLRESSLVGGQNATDPVACARLRFGPNVERCERMLNEAYAPLPPLERAPLCATDRERFGTASMLCGEYDEARSAQLYDASLQERGITAWEPAAPISRSGTLHVRTLDSSSTLTLVCNGAIVPMNWSVSDDDRNRVRVSYDLSQDATCTLIATTPIGSISSAEFSLVGK